jgi:hypothetical protein
LPAPAVAAVAGLSPDAGDRADRSVGRDPPDGVIGRVAEVNRPVRTDHEAGRVGELRLHRRPAVAGEALVADTGDDVDAWRRRRGAEQQ